MKFINDNILCVEFGDLAECGFDARNVSSYISKGYRGWAAIDDPDDKRRTLIPYEQMTDAVKQQLAVKYGNVYEYMRAGVIKGLLKADAEAFKYYAAQGLAKDYVTKYTAAAEWLNMLLRVSKEKKKFFNALGMDSKSDFYNAAIALIKAGNIDLPHNYTRLMEKVRRYAAGGYAALVSNKFGNSNSQKISDEAGEWLCGYYSQFWKPTLEKTHIEYYQQCDAKGWAKVTKEAIYAYLYKAEIMERWYYNRHGELEYIKRYGIQQKLRRTSCSNALWLADGTGLNLMSADEKQQRMYYVMDDYSEVILGYSIEASENEIAVYKAFKEALTFAAVRPYELRYDNAGAHKRLETFFDAVTTKLHFACKPYNGRGKSSIERSNNSFLRTHLREWFFNTGHNRGARLLNNQYNAYAFKQGEDRKVISMAIPTLAEIKALVKHLVKEWNNANHSKLGIPRLQAYQQSVNTQAVPFTAMDMVECFWSQTEKVFNAEGVKLTIGRKEYHFDVYADIKGKRYPDAGFRQRWVGEKMIVKYDPDDLSYVCLYEKTDDGPRFIAQADEKLTTAYAAQDQTTEDKSYMHELIHLQDKQVTDAAERAKELAERTGFTPAQVVERQRKKLHEITLAEMMRGDDMNDLDEDSGFEFVEAYRGNVNAGKRLD